MTVSGETAMVTLGGDESLTDDELDSLKMMMMSVIEAEKERYAAQMKGMAPAVDEQGNTRGYVRTCAKVHPNSVYGGSWTAEDDGATETKGHESSIKHKFNTDGATDDEEDTEDAVRAVYVYDCPRTVKNQKGEEEDCDGAVKPEKDYGERLFRQCPECGEDVAMVKQ